MYYNESGAFDKTPLINARNNNFIPQQTLEPESATGENNNLLFWCILALGGVGGLILLIKYLDTPLTGS